MTKGRKPLPTAIKEMRGTVQPCRVNKNEVRVDALEKLPPAPRWMSKTQKKIYRTKGAQLRALRVLTPLDFELFISFCREYGNYLDTAKELDALPMKANFTEAADNVYKRMSKRNKESWERARAIASEFGFTPSSRARLVHNENDDDPFESDFS